MSWLGPRNSYGKAATDASPTTLPIFTNLPKTFPLEPDNLATYGIFFPVKISLKIQSLACTLWGLQKL